MLHRNYHRQSQINITLCLSLCLCIYVLLQLPPLPVIFSSGLAPLISGWGLWTGERGIVEVGWMLSPAPPCVYLPLPAGLLREQEIERRGAREGKQKGRDRYKEKKREKPGRRNETRLQCKQTSKHLRVCRHLLYPTLVLKSTNVNILICIQTSVKTYLHFK